MTFLVLVTCSACQSYTRLRVPARQCHASADHIHVASDDPHVASWWASHHAPSMEVITRIN